jgi:hypothetical protein
LRSVLRPVLTATALVILYYLIPINEKPTKTTAAILLVGLAAVLALFAWQIHAIMRSSKPRLRAVEALATTLPLFILLFAVTYYLIDITQPSTFSEPLTRTDSLYFTITVLSTVGFGDIVARSEPARIAVMIQMVADILLIGVAARIMTSTVRAALQRQDGARPQDGGQESSEADSANPT